MAFLFHHSGWGEGVEAAGAGFMLEGILRNGRRRWGFWWEGGSLREGPHLKIEIWGTRLRLERFILADGWKKGNSRSHIRLRSGQALRDDNQKSKGNFNGKGGQYWSEDPKGECRVDLFGILHCVQDDGKNMRAKTTATATATADPPFGFAQGRLCGDDNQKSNGRGGAVLVGKFEGLVWGGLLRGGRSQGPSATGTILAE
jgi:hypothetical protein